LVYGRVTKLVPFGAFVQVGEGIEGLVHISELAAHHVDTPDQVVTAGEELWVKIIELDTARRRISLSVKQAAEGGEVSEEYREAFGSHAYDTEGNYIGGIEYGEFTPKTEAQAAWAEYATEAVVKSPEDGEATPANDQPAETADDAAIDETSASEMVTDPPDGAEASSESDKDPASE
jgi:small subunit ribosomal protein S1